WLDGELPDQAGLLGHEAAVLVECALVRRERRDDVADPPEHAAGADPESGRDDQPEDRAEKIAVVDLPDARNDDAEHGGDTRIARHGRTCACSASRTNASIAGEGRAPAVRVTSCPCSNTAIVGIDRMRKRSPSSGTASVFTLTTRKRPAADRATF